MLSYFGGKPRTIIFDLVSGVVTWYLLQWERLMDWVHAGLSPDELEEVQEDYQKFKTFIAKEQQELDQ